MLFLSQILDHQECTLLRNGVFLDSKNDKRKSLRTLVDRVPLKFMICYILG